MVPSAGRPEPDRAEEDGDLGDVDLVRAVLDNPNGVLATALRLVVQQTGWSDLELAGPSENAGRGGECTVVKTRLYAGIPTLSQYGLLLMALLMLGVGLVGFRRYA